MIMSEKKKESSEEELVQRSEGGVQKDHLAGSKRHLQNRQRQS